MTVNPEPAMKPQDTIIFMLGELKGEMRALSATVESSQSTQAAVNASVVIELASVKASVGKHSEDIAVIQSRIGPRLSWPLILSALVSVAALVLAIINRITIIP